MSPPPLQPPGWYFAHGDPPATNRWCDGTQWVGGPVASGGFDPFGAAYPFAVIAVAVIGGFFAHWASGLLCYLVYFWMLWDGQKQTWHDKMTDAVVVKVDH